MNTDNFTEAARKRAERRVPLDGGEPDLIFRDRRELVEMAEWARDYLTAQEPTDAEKAVRELHRPVDVEPSDTICAACSTLRGSGESLRYFPTEEWPCATIQALDAARAARRDEEKRASCGCDLSGMTPPAVHIVDRHEAPTTRRSTR